MPYVLNIIDQSTKGQRQMPLKDSKSDPIHRLIHKSSGEVRKGYFRLRATRQAALSSHRPAGPASFLPSFHPAFCRDRRVSVASIFRDITAFSTGKFKFICALTWRSRDAPVLSCCLLAANLRGKTFSHSGTEQNKNARNVKGQKDSSSYKLLGGTTLNDSASAPLQERVPWNPGSPRFIAQDAASQVMLG